MSLKAKATALGIVFSCATSAAAMDVGISPLSPAAENAMLGRSWNSGCPVSLSDLVSVRVRYVGFDGVDHEGDIVIHKRFGTDVAEIFQELYDIRFPINAISPYENFEVGKYADSDATVGFYCRKAQDAPTEWSGHAYGAAIDINPLENPFLDAHTGWWPAKAASMSPRDDGRGKAAPGNQMFLIFAKHGWAWGGYYAGEPDYMHFYKLTIGTGDPLARHYIAKNLQFRPDAQQSSSK